MLPDRETPLYRKVGRQAHNESANILSYLRMPVVISKMEHNILFSAVGDHQTERHTKRAIEVAFSFVSDLRKPDGHVSRCP